ncbi:MAG TPA: glycine zipper 2TM domain-containing protein [Casimicrobiaceae bacterium]
MKRTFKLACALVALALWSVGAAAQNPPTMAPGRPAPPSAGCTTCGVVESVRHVERKGEGSGVGAIAGGVLGGVLGHQIGSGRGNTAATIVGAGAGAYAGNEVEKNSKKKSYYVVAVRLDNGRRQTITQGARPGVREGDRVKIVGGNRLALIAN